MKKGPLILLAFGLSIGWTFALQPTLFASGSKMQIPAGFNLLETTSGTTLETGMVPAGFFGSKNGTPSDPVDLATVPLQGRPITPPGGAAPDMFQLGVAVHNGGDTCHATVDVRDGGGVASTDAVFERLTAATLNTIGAEAQISFVIRALSLESISPIQVTYGGEPSSFFDFYLELDPGSTQLGGSATLIRNGAVGGDFNSSLPVTSRLTFTNVNPAGPAAITSPVRTDNLIGTGSFVFLSIPTPSLLLWGMISLTAVVLIIGGILVRRQHASLQAA